MTIDKIIDSIKQMLEYWQHNGNVGWNPYVSIETLKASIEALIAQEPRVMTLSGVRNLKEGTPVWLEDVDKKAVIGALFFDDHSLTKSVDFVTLRNRDFKRIMADYGDYGIRWRCWTSCPTDEQRKKVEWK